MIIFPGEAFSTYPDQQETIKALRPQNVANGWLAKKKSKLTR